MTITKDLGRLIACGLPTDPNVRLPDDVRATIARGDEAFKNQDQGTRARATHGNDLSRVITAVTDQTVQEQRDRNIDARAQPTKGRRRQPPMIPRLQAAMIVVDRLKADGIPFGVGPNSKMNKAVREWLNEKARRSTDPRPSRRKQIGPTAVRELLKQVKAEGREVSSNTGFPRRAPQEVAGELLKKLRESQASGSD
jgi:hypothetical protein